ncbi:MAG: sodium:solute symporter [Bacteroidetes bacterium]|nr:sodium:solute symporter [Bacteroidota bacterium]MBP6401777.1 sodium:solute symporter [Bacteroidia bacterium]MBK9526000.1 sodium:solute symporter [Bacteroidota bacterium]MBK9542529.1 sodium:solute symporter [Bacteroidota bacterium]MBL0256010.1 sodium:solute symporter [Bacteroidota bacterium]
MSPNLILTCVVAYSAMLFYVVWRTSRHADNESFFIGNKSSKWFVVAYGMIGASLSGVTFMSVPGWVGTTQYTYLMVVFGYLVGYTVIATILLPLYYRLNLTSIYSYLETRFGFWSYKTGAFYFILSRTIGASFRLFVVVNVLQTFVFDNWGVPFWLTVATFIALILLYTFKGGVKTIVWTDMLQTTFMLLSMVLSVILIARQMDMSFGALIDKLVNGDYTKIVNTEWRPRGFFLKQFFGGMFIAIAMTGLDQEMMQKNISVKTLKDSQKNMFTFSIILLFVNMMFLALGALLYMYSASKGIALPTRSSDDLFPTIALNSLGTMSAVFFIIGLISAAYPSADGALTALTASFCIDFLGIKKQGWTEEKQKNVRYKVHISFAVLLLVVIVIFRMINDDAVINKLFTVAGYTYGPLLGLYAFGLFSKAPVKDKLVPLICLISPVFCYVLNEYSEVLFNGYKFGFELLILNGMATYAGLVLIREKPILA